VPPLALPSLTASTMKRAAKLMVAALRAKLPPPIVQQLVSNPALLRALVDEMSLFVGGNTMTLKRDVIAALLQQKRSDLANVVAGTKPSKPTRKAKGRVARPNTKRKVQAGSWQDKAKAELEAEQGGIETEEQRGGGRDFIILSLTEGSADDGHTEWMVFKDSNAAERHAVEAVEEMLNDDPESFDQKFLKQHVYVSPTDIRIIAGEEADNYIENIREDDEGMRLLEEAGMDRKYDALQSKVEQLRAKQEAEMDPKKAERYQGQINKLDAAQQTLVEKAEEKLHDELYNRTKKQLEDDPMEWAEELGYDFGRNRPNWINIDTRKAAQEAVDVDGVAHFLGEGDETELDSGAVAYGRY